MTPAHPDVFESALALPEAERALLAECLLESLSPEPDEFTDEQFAMELDRRYEEFQRDPTKAVSWEEVRRQARTDS